MDAHGHALGQPYPLKGRTDIGQQLKTGAAVLLSNTPNGLSRSLRFQISGFRFKLSRQRPVERQRGRQVLVII